MSNPTTRPSMQKILSMSYVKRHLSKFFAEILSRPQVASEGAVALDGTAVFKAAALHVGSSTSSEGGATEPTACASTPR